MKLLSPAVSHPVSGQTIQGENGRNARNRLITIAVVDDHRIIREGIASLLRACPDMAFVGGAGDVQSAYALIARDRPDVVLCDLNIPGNVGADLIRKLRADFPNTDVIVLTMHASSLAMQKVLNAGASAFACKHDDFDELITIIRHVAAGGGAVCSSSMEKVSGLPNTAPLQLSPREREVLNGIASGYSSIKIGARLGISPKTVDIYRARLMQKFGVKRSTALLWLAIESGIVSAFSPDHPLERRSEADSG